MKKYIIILISLFILFSSFAAGFIVKKHIDDKKFDSILNVKLMLEKKNEKFSEEIISLEKTLKKCIVLKDNKWEKLTEDIYIDKNSIITKNKYSTSAWFIIFASEGNNLYDVNGVPVHHALIKYDAGCKADALCMNHIKKFDEDGKILYDEIDTYGICSDSSGWIEGQIAFNALCKYKNKGRVI